MKYLLIVYITCLLRHFKKVLSTDKFDRFQDYEVDLYLRQKWQDERLKHPDITEVLDLNDPNLVKAIWKPEVYFPNAKHAEFQFVTVPNVLIRINPDGEILYMLRYFNFYLFIPICFTIDICGTNAVTLDVISIMTII